MQFFRRWLAPQTASDVSLNPSRTLQMRASPASAFDRCLDGIERVLGGSIDRKDRSAGTIEARFGLINSERLSVSIEPGEDGSSRVRIESRRGASAERPRSSQYVDALYAFLTE
ncbi:MAG TPA: hypothetical protein VFA29_04815 [Candidatus Baltobacteraceae bacterium]|nr:hypothetical protein [Candidatus Baltobacteraceae bacterium]